MKIKKIRQIIGEFFLVFYESVLITTGSFPIETSLKRQHNAGIGGSLGFGSGEAESQQDVPADGKNCRRISRSSGYAALRLMNGRSTGRYTLKKLIVLEVSWIQKNLSKMEIKNFLTKVI